MATSVRDAMTEEPHSIDASALIVEAARLMRDENIGSLPITDDGKLAGMITDRDITTTVVADGQTPRRRRSETSAVRIPSALSPTRTLRRRSS